MKRSPPTVTSGGGKSDSYLRVKKLRVDKAYMRLVRETDIPFVFWTLEHHFAKLRKAALRRRQMAGWRGFNTGCVQKLFTQ